MNVLKIAWRNVWRNTRRSIVTMVAMTLAFFVLVLYSGLVEGYLLAMERNVLDMEVGDIQVHAEGYLDRPSKYVYIKDASALLDALEAKGLAAAPRMIAGGLLGAEDVSAGVSLQGIDLARDPDVFALHEAVDRGDWLAVDDPQGIVVGQRLARVLGVEPGDELVLLTQAMDGSSSDALLHVRGVLKSVADGTDRSAVFMAEAYFRELMVFPTGAHRIVVRRPADAELDAVAADVATLAPTHDVRTWRQLMPTIAQMLDSTRGMIVFIFLVVYLAVGILILNAMLMAVFERIREFGVFKAIGAGPGRIMSIILLESGIQVCVALLVGGALAVPAGWYLATHGLDLGAMGGMSVAGVAMEPVWYGVYTAETISGPVIMLVLITLAAVIYPALKAAWLRPVDAMRHR